MWDSAERASQAYKKPLDMVTSFKYLVRVLMAGEDDCLALMVKLKKASNRWARMTSILGLEGANLRISGMLFKAVVQAVLLFGSETWVMTTCMERSLGIFQHRVAQRITESQTRRRKEGGWGYPPLVTDM